MQEMIETIRAALASDASKEQKAAGATACRMILTALDTEPGTPLTVPGVAPTPVTSRVSIDQVLDLMIARLGMIAQEREQAETKALPSPTPTPIAPVAPRGLRVPLATSGALNAAARRSAARPVAPNVVRPATPVRTTPQRKS